MKILFVCTGNICRSPVAQRILEDKIDVLGLPVTVASAGTLALNDQPMHPESQRVLRDRGIEPGSFRSRMLDSAIAEDCDLLLGMTRGHRASARQLSPARWRRMFALREFSTDVPPEMPSGPAHRQRTRGQTDEWLDIADPVGKSSRVFDEVANDIAAAIEPLAAWLTSRTLTDQNAPW